MKARVTGDDPDAWKNEKSIENETEQRKTAAVNITDGISVNSQRTSSRSDSTDSTGKMMSIRSQRIKRNCRLIWKKN